MAAGEWVVRKVSDTLWEVHPAYQRSERLVVVVPTLDNTLRELTFQRLGKRPHLIQNLYWITSSKVLRNDISTGRTVHTPLHGEGAGVADGTPA